MYSLVLFAARSTKGITRLSPTVRASIKLPDEVKDVLIGILLGDTHICGIVVKRLVFFVYYYFFIWFLIFYKVYINFASLKVVYLNLKAKKAIVLKENKGKSGIYL